ncbi:Zinc finger and BTB domain-containing protein 26 [Nymphon striatum]|nr:Zinc finger and BTB domain-containing protein 26 [Nymphon striatum]
MPLEINEIKQEKEDSPSSMFNLYDGCSREKQDQELSRTTIKNERGVEIEKNDNVASSSPRLSFEMKTIKVENDNSLNDVINHCVSTPQEIEHEDIDEELLHNPSTTNYEMGFSRWGRTTIKKEPGIEIVEDNIEASSKPNWLSFEMNKSKEENEDSPNSVIDYSNGNPLEVEHENVNKEFNQETHKNVVNSTFPNVFGNNTGYAFKYHHQSESSSRMKKNDFADVNSYICDICHKCFTLRNSFKKHMHIHINKKRFQCNVCLKCFTQSSSLKDHMRYSHKRKTFRM